MAFTETERAENLSSLKWFVEHTRPPERLREQVDIGYTIVGHTVDLHEIRCPNGKILQVSAHTHS
jgi:hypothetical protein